MALISYSFLLCGGCHETEEIKATGQSNGDGPDVTVEYEIENPDSISRNTVRMKGLQIRMDTEDGRFSSIHGREGDCFVLNHDERTFHEIVDDCPEELPKETDSSSIEEALKMQFTDRKRKIGDWECREFVMMDSMDMNVHSKSRSRIVFWIATDFKEGISVQGRMDKIRGGHFSEFVRHIKNQTGKDLSLPGMAILMEATNKRGLLGRATVKKISFGTVPGNIFQIPNTYTEFTEP